MKKNREATHVTIEKQGEEPRRYQVIRRLPMSASGEQYLLGEPWPKERDHTHGRYPGEIVPVRVCHAPTHRIACAYTGGEHIKFEWPPEQSFLETLQRGGR